MLWLCCKCRRSGLLSLGKVEMNIVLVVNENDRQIVGCGFTLIMRVVAKNALLRAPRIVTTVFDDASELANVIKVVGNVVFRPSQVKTVSQL